MSSTQRKAEKAQKKVEKTLYDQLGIDSKATKQQISGAYNDLLNKVRGFRRFLIGTMPV